MLLKARIVDFKLNKLFNLNLFLIVFKDNGIGFCLDFN